uniref:UBA domain-containing protein n=1 Tax=Solanum lycopersicum TaxID=4081 RepID=A0A3Q7ENG8_SOLLC
MDPDQVVAGLVGMGFSLSDIANALEDVGPSIASVIDYLLDDSRRKTASASTSTACFTRRAVAKVTSEAGARNFTRPLWRIFRKMLWNLGYLTKTDLFLQQQDQILALLTGKVVIVMSQLISLMQNQCLRLAKHVVSACFLGSGQTV